MHHVFEQHVDLRELDTAIARAWTHLNVNIIPAINYGAIFLQGSSKRSIAMSEQRGSIRVVADELWKSSAVPTRSCSLIDLKRYPQQVQSSRQS